MGSVQVMNRIFEMAWRRTRWWMLMPAVMTALAEGPAWALAPVDAVPGATLWTPQPEAAALHPGLAVTYSYGRQVHVD
ncbi:MAG: hypothetical protein QF787_14150, partial [Nitrospinota bacterium]|nr:hypothetical protein [Nitrospinota bacterium]